MAIDVLRILSVAIVLTSHYHVYPPLDPGGTRGVALFFMISGYCMAFSTRGRTGLQFLAARLWRLVPALIICATITMVTEAVWSDIRPDRVQTWMDYLRNITCLPAGNLVCDAYFQVQRGAPTEYLWVDGAYWSLLVELRFYVLLWALYYGARLRSPSFIISALALVGASWSPAFLSKGADFFPYLSFFGFGMAIREIRDGRTIGYLAAVLGFISFGVNVMRDTTMLSMSLNAENFFGYFLCFVVFAAVIFGWRRGYRSWIERLGILTYPVYLLHQDIGLIIIAGLEPSLGQGFVKILAIAVVLALGMMVQAFIDQVIPPLRKRLSHRPRPRPTA